jgi:hypothetical protein
MVFERAAENPTSGEIGKRQKQIEVLIPFKSTDQQTIPDYLQEFIENDPTFYPEIHSNNLEDAFLSIHEQNDDTANFGEEKIQRLLNNNEEKEYEGAVDITIGSSNTSSLLQPSELLRSSYMRKGGKTLRKSQKKSYNPSTLISGEPVSVPFSRQVWIMFLLKSKLLLSKRNILLILQVLSWLLFLIMVLSVHDALETKTVSIKTVDMIYKALENFIFLSISGIFLFIQIDDYKS